MFAGNPPANGPPRLGFIFMLPIGDPMPTALGPAEPDCGDIGDLPAIPIRCSCRARAFCMISRGRLFALGGGLRAVFKMPDTLELALILPVCWGSETVRSDGTLRGTSSELELGGSSGVLALEESTEPGEAGLLSEYSSGVSGESRSYWSAMAKAKGCGFYLFCGFFLRSGEWCRTHLKVVAASGGACQQDSRTEIEEPRGDRKSCSIAGVLYNTILWWASTNCCKTRSDRQKRMLRGDRGIALYWQWD